MGGRSALSRRPVGFCGSIFKLFSFCCHTKNYLPENLFVMFRCYFFFSRKMSKIDVRHALLCLSGVQEKTGGVFGEPS